MSEIIDYKMIKYKYPEDRLFMDALTQLYGEPYVIVVNGADYFANAWNDRFHTELCFRRLRHLGFEQVYYLNGNIFYDLSSYSSACAQDNKLRGEN